MKKPIIVSLLSILPLTGLLAAEDKAQVIPVMVVPVSADTQALSQNLPGRIAAYRTAQVRARVSGIIQARVFEEGGQVDAGQVLFKIEDRSLKATLRARKADVANAQAAYALSRQTLKRYKKLLSMGAVSKQEYDSNVAQSQQSKAQLEQAKANLEIAAIDLEYATVTAPISGRIDRALVTEGALTTSGTTQLATIEQIDKVYVDFTRPSADLLAIREATEAGKLKDTSNKNIEVYFSDGSRYPLKAHLEFSSMSVEQDTGAIALRAVVENPNASLLPGMFVRVKIPVATTQNTLKVPQKAVNITAQGPQVFLVKDKKLVPQKITLGPMSGDSWYVKSGLSATDRVVTSDTTILSTLPGASFVGMTAAEMQAAGMAPKKEK